MIHFRRVWLEVGWFKGEPFKLFHFTFIEKGEFITIFEIQVMLFIFGFGFE